VLTASESSEQCAPLAPDRGADRVLSGSSGWLLIEAENGFWQTISAIKILARRGMSLLVAKRAVEEMVEFGHARVFAAHIDEGLEGELGAQKVRVTVLASDAAAAAE
jgi:hypothetical protein